jgi:lysophospholipase L1-like esterase
LIAAPATTSRATAGEGQVRALFFGDSLMEGIGAQPQRPIMALTAARELGWDVTVDAGPGTGYVNCGKQGRTYLQRLSRHGVLSPAYDVVLLEGGTNDLRADPATMPARTTQTVRYVRSRLPHAQIVLMGAFNPRARGTTPGGSPSTASSARWPPSCPCRTSVPSRAAGPTRKVRDSCPRDGLHPSTYGYRVMACKLVAALRATAAAVHAPV